MSSPIEYFERNGHAAETPEAPNAPAPRRVLVDPPTNHITITAELYEAMIRESERLKLIENYIINASYPDKDILHAMVGYTGEE